MYGNITRKQSTTGITVVICYYLIIDQFAQLFIVSENLCPADDNIGLQYSRLSTTVWPSMISLERGNIVQ